MIVHEWFNWEPISQYYPSSASVYRHCGDSLCNLKYPLCFLFKDCDGKGVLYSIQGDAKKMKNRPQRETNAILNRRPSRKLSLLHNVSLFVVWSVLNSMVGCILEKQIYNTYIWLLRKFFESIILLFAYGESFRILKRWSSPYPRQQDYHFWDAELNIGKNVVMRKRHEIQNMHHALSKPTFSNVISKNVQSLLNQGIFDENG